MFISFGSVASDMGGAVVLYPRSLQGDRRGLEGE